MLIAELERTIINLGFVYLRPFSLHVSLESYKFSLITASTVRDISQMYSHVIQYLSKHTILVAS